MDAARPPDSANSHAASPDSAVAIENLAGIARVTCGWKKPGLALDFVRRYWRDVHSPAISRRPGLHEYRHHQYDAVRADLFAPLDGVGFECPADQQLMWLSDVRYRDEAALALFAASPEPAVKAMLLADIDILVDQSTTYRAVGTSAQTLLDLTGDPAPQGPPPAPAFGVFFRQRGSEAPFQAALRALAARWAEAAGVLRVRLNLFEVPDMEAERQAGYPIKTHPKERQYQAWAELIVADAGAARGLLALEPGLAREVITVHAYPVAATYTSVCAGKPTLVGLRGYPAHEAIAHFDAAGQRDPALLAWMYGAVAR